MTPENPFERIKRLEKYLIGLPVARNRNMLSREQRDTMNEVLDNAALARKQFEFSVMDEDATAQAQGFDLTIEQLKVIRQGLLHPSMQEQLSAVDVSQLTSLAELCMEDVKAMILRSKTWH